MDRFPIDEVVVSANEHPLYLPFWPIVAWAYRTVFGVPATLVFLSERREDDPFIAQLCEYGNVVFVRPVPDIPQAAQAKLARYWYAARRGAAVIYIDDIDWIPIDRDWHLSKVASRAQGSLLLVGSEVYGGEEKGQAPASMMTAEGGVYRKLFNPDDLPFPAYLASLSGRAGRHREVRSRVNHEGMDCTTNQEHLDGQTLFSDEALVVRLREERPVPVTLVVRGYEPGVGTIDRASWPFSQQKLEHGGYLGAHTGRPLAECLKGNLAIVEYLRGRYGADDSPRLLDQSPGIDPDMTFDARFPRGALEWVLANVDPARLSVFEFGSGHVSTNYLTRYYWVTSVEDDLAFVNIYPAHYIYAPGKPGGWYDPDLVRYGMSRYPPYKPYGVFIIDGPVGSERRAGILANLAGIVDLRVPILVDDVSRDVEEGLVWEIASRAGREPTWYDGFAVI